MGGVGHVKCGYEGRLSRGGTGQGPSLGSGQLMKILQHKQTNKLVKAWVKISRLGLGASLS